jgi:hypothetical protein
MAMLASIRGLGEHEVLLNSTPGTWSRVERLDKSVPVLLPLNYSSRSRVGSGLQLLFLAEENVMMRKAV